MKSETESKIWTATLSALASFVVVSLAGVVTKQPLTELRISTLESDVRSTKADVRELRDYLIPENERSSSNGQEEHR